MPGQNHDRFQDIVLEVPISVLDEEEAYAEKYNFGHAKPWNSLRGSKNRGKPDQGIR